MGGRGRRTVGHEAERHRFDECLVEVVLGGHRGDGGTNPPQRAGVIGAVGDGQDPGDEPTQRRQAGAVERLLEQVGVLRDD